MTSLILLDANVFTYVAGRAHSLQEPSRLVLALAERHEVFFTDAEVFQELLHRYRALHIWAEMQERFGDFLELMMGRIEPMYDRDVESAGSMASRYPRLSARDLIHVAVMQRVGAQRIVTADAAFDGVEGIERLDLARVDEWRSLVRV